MPDNSPQAIWGRLLRSYRKRSGLTQPELGDRIGYAPSTISGIETGQEPANIMFARACDRELDTGGALEIALDYRNDEPQPSWFDLPQYEVVSRIIRNYERTVVPGLLQTEAYARVILHGNEDATARRMKRQQVLHRSDPPPPVFTCVIHESVLYHLIGSPEVTRKQLEYLLDITSDRIHVHVIPEGEERPCILGAFALVALAEGGEIAYVDTALRGMTLGGTADISHLNEVWELVRSQAYPVKMSLDLITKAIESRWT